MFLTEIDNQILNNVPGHDIDDRNGDDDIIELNGTRKRAIILSSYPHNDYHGYRSLTVEFPSDETIKRMMKECLTEMVRTCYFHKARDWKVPDRVKVPEDFRNSIFNTSFYTDYDDCGDNGHEENEKIKIRERTPEEQNPLIYNQFDCRCLLTDNITIRNNIQIMTLQGYNDKTKTKTKVLDYSGGRHCQHLGDNSGYKEESLFKTADYVDGFQFAGNGQHSFTCCQTCRDEYTSPQSSSFEEKNMKKELSSCLTVILPTDLVNIIFDYLRLPPSFTLVKVDEELIQTSTYIDWVPFLTIFLEEDSKDWYINCNLDNPLYGCIMMCGNQNEMFVSSNKYTIKDFETRFLEILGRTYQV
jgi:hypothetical protein